MRLFYLLLLIVLCSGTYRAKAQCDTNMLASDSLQWVFARGEWPGNVHAMERLKDTLYLGGLFDYVGKYSGYFAGVDTSSGKIIQHGSWPKVNGPVYASVPDGNGGFIIAGSFFRVGDSARRNIARISATGVVEAFNPGTNDTVFSIVLNSGTVYIGGSFTSAAGSTRNRLAAITLSTGAVTSWNPGSNGTVRALATDGATLFAGGQFTTVATVSRQNIAAIDLSTAAATSFNPGAGTTGTHTVSCIVLSADRVYIGGLFNSVGGQTRNNIAACVKSTGAVTTWNPNANNRVNAMLLTRNMLYAGGGFTNIGGKIRQRLAAIDTATAAANNWVPFHTGTVNTGVYSLALIDKVMYAGGNFRITWNALERSHVAAIDTSGTGTLRSLNKYPNKSGIVHTIQAAGTNVYMGGTFASIEGADRSCLAGIDVKNNLLLPLNHEILGEIRDIHIDDSRMYVAGVSLVNSVARKHVASFDIANNYALTSWDPLNVSGIVSNNVAGLTVAGDYVYLTGQFDFTSNGRHIDAAKVHKTTGAVDAWAPYSGSAIGQAVTKDATNIYMGAFLGNHSGGASVIMQYNPATNVTTHYPLSGNVWNMKVYHNKLFCTGTLTDGIIINRAASAVYPGGNLTSWQPVFNDPLTLPRIYSTTGYRDLMLVTGLFDTADGQKRMAFAAMDTAFGRSYGAWQPRFTYGETGLPSVYDVFVWGGDTVFISGSQTHVAGKSIFSLARFHVRYEAPSVNITVADDSVCQGTEVIVRATIIKDATYKWLKNGVLQTGNADTFKFIPQHDDSLTCELTAPYTGCYLSLNAVSNHIKFEVTKADTPKVDIVASLNPVPCAGMSDTFSAVSTISGITYKWLVNGATTGANDDTLIYKPANGDKVSCVITVPAIGCFSKPEDTSNEITLTVTPKVTPTISIAGPGLALLGANVSLTATIGNAGANYNINWRNNGNSFANTSTPNASYIKAAGTDNITAVITPAGCYDTAISNTLVVQEDLGVNNIAKANGINVYPNPVGDVLNMVGLKQGDMVTLSDVTGRKLAYNLVVTQDKPQHEIQLSGLSKGIYFVEITDKEGNSRGIVKLEKL